MENTIRMSVDGALDSIEAYRRTVDGLRELGWKDLELDSKNRGINASFESPEDIWEILLNFEKDGMYEVQSRSSWKIGNEISDIVQHLVNKINQGNSTHDFRMNDNGAFEVKTRANISEEKEFMESIKKSMIENIQAYESYVGMLKRFVNIKPEYLDKETEGFKALMDSNYVPIRNEQEPLISINLQK